VNIGKGAVLPFQHKATVTRHFWLRLRSWYKHLIYDEKYTAIGYWGGVVAAHIWHASAGLMIGWLIAGAITFFTG